MLNKQTTDEIIDLIRQKPRAVQEVAFSIKKNWRTADRYIDIIAKETGLIATRTFREGSRGALKVVYWNALDRAKGSAYQELLLQRIIHGKKKEDFSPFDIYQFASPDKRESYLEYKEFSTHPQTRYDKLLEGAKQQLLLFSGNLSWMELGPNTKQILESLARKKVSIKVITRVDVTSLKNTNAILDINKRVGWDAVEVRHCEQPLRAVIVDDSLVSIKEVLSPLHHRELKKKTFIFYKIKDIEWINWMQKAFWHLWGQSIDAQTRLEALKTLQPVG